MTLGIVPHLLKKRCWRPNSRHGWAPSRSREGRRRCDETAPRAAGALVEVLFEHLNGLVVLDGAVNPLTDASSRVPGCRRGYPAHLDDYIRIFGFDTPSEGNTWGGGSVASIAPKKGGRVFGRYYVMSPEEVSALAHRRRAQLISDALTLILILTFIPILIITLILTLVAGESAHRKPERQPLTPRRCISSCPPLGRTMVDRSCRRHIRVRTKKR